LPGKKLLRAAEFFCFGFDARRGDQGFDILSVDGDRIELGELMNDFANRIWIAESVLFDDRVGDSVAVLVEKF
jgi:hypothetical protein